MLKLRRDRCTARRWTRSILTGGVLFSMRRWWDPGWAVLGNDGFASLLLPPPPTSCFSQGAFAKLPSKATKLRGQKIATTQKKNLVASTARGRLVQSPASYLQ